jgi:hypothetical protein
MPLNRKPLLTSEQIVEKSDAFAVPCDHCNARGYIGHNICGKCEGNGCIVITPLRPLTISERALRQMFWILLGASSLVLVAIALLHWFHLL